MGRGLLQGWRGWAVGLALLWACGPGLAATPASSMDVVLVVDTSGSMGWDVDGRRKSAPGFSAPPRIDRVVEALERYANKLPDGTRLRLISFNSGIKTNREFVVSEATRVDLIAAVNGLKREVNTGDTWLWEAMREGIKAAESYAQGDPDLTVTLYVLTDGEYDNKTPAEPLSLGKVLGESRRLGTDSVYASLVLLGKPKSQGGSFSDSYLDQLKREAGNRSDVQMDDDFDPLFPPILEVLPEKVVPNQKASVIENSAMQFARVEWSLDGKPAGSQKSLVFTPPKFGRYEITFKGYDRSGRRARARKVLIVGQEPVRAIPQISIDGKPFQPGTVVTKGQSLSLSSASTGPVAKVEWTVNGQKTAAATVNRVLDAVGEQTISLAVESVAGPGGEVTRSGSQSIVFQVVAQGVDAVPTIAVNGEPLESVDAVYAGDTLQLVSKSTGPVQAAVWTVNGKELSGNTVQWQVPAAGDVSIMLKVTGPEAGQVDEADLIRIAAKKRPPVWMLWAMGIVGTGILGFLTWLLTGNQVRDARISVEGGRDNIKVRKFFSRFTKAAVIPIRRLSDKEYWRTRPEKETMRVSRRVASKGLAVKMQCDFAHVEGGPVSFGERPGTALQSEMTYRLEDRRDPDKPQSIDFKLRPGKSTHGDLLLLAGAALALLAGFFWFYIKIYPSL
jgi:hypothetical protein